MPLIRTRRDLMKKPLGHYSARLSQTAAVSGSAATLPIDERRAKVSCLGNER
jgi:hypothetical protein